MIVFSSSTSSVRPSVCLSFIFISAHVSPLSPSAPRPALLERATGERQTECEREREWVWKTERERMRQTERQRRRECMYVCVCVDYINGCSLEWKAWRRSLLPPRLCLLALATLQTARLDIAFNNIWSCFFAYSLFATPPLPPHHQPILSPFNTNTHSHLHTHTHTSLVKEEAFKFKFEAKNNVTT